MASTDTDLRSRLAQTLASVLGKPGKDKPSDGSEGMPRPELGEFASTGDARYAGGMVSRTFDRKKGEWVMAHRIDRISYRDYDRVRFYPTVRDALNAIRLPLERANFHFECADQSLADLAMQELGPQIRGLVSKLAKGGLEFGRATVEKVWELKKNVEVCSTQSSAGTGGKVWRYVWSLNRTPWLSPEDTELLIWPDNGELAGIRQFAGGMRTGDRDIAATKLIHYAHDAEFDSNYGTPRTKACIPFVDLALNLYDDASLYFSRFATPSLIGYAPNVSRETGRDADGNPILTNSLNFMRNTIASIRNAHGVVLPDERDPVSGAPKWSIQPLEVGQNGLFVEYGLHLNTMIGAALCVPQLALSTVPASGTYNLGQAQIDLFTQNEEALLDSIREVLDRDLCDDFRVFNAGNDAPPLRLIFEPVSQDVSDMLLQALVEQLGSGQPLFTADGQVMVTDWLKIAGDKGVPFIKMPAPPQGQGMGAAPGPQGPGGMAGMPGQSQTDEAPPGKVADETPPPANAQSGGSEGPGSGPPPPKPGDHQGGN